MRKNVFFVFMIFAVNIGALSVMYCFLSCGMYLLAAVWTKVFANKRKAERFLMSLWTGSSKRRRRRRKRQKPFGIN